MNAPIDISGQRYGRLVAIKRAISLNRRTAWLFHCDCGTQPILQLERVRAGVTASCGCLRIDATRSRSMTHGHAINRRASRTLKSYNHARSRCQDTRDPKYPQYGGRGITMCPEWTADFQSFLKDMGECPEGLTLDRSDVNGNYEPGNCRWATNAQQARNRTDNVYVEHGGQRLILKDYASLMGVPYKGLHRRVKYYSETPADAVKHLLGG